MAISGTSCSTCSSSSLTALGSNQLRKEESTENKNITPNGDKNSQREPAEFIFRGELLDEIDDLNKNNGFRAQKDQTIDPANQTAINNYEENNRAPLANFINTQGNILDAYA